MLLPVLHVDRSQFLVMDDKQILGILLLSSLREVEAAGYGGLAVYHHDLVVRNRMDRITLILLELGYLKNFL